MDSAQYSRIENDKTDPTFSTIEKIAKAFGMELSELYRANELFKDISSYDRTRLEKINLIDKLDDKEKQAFFSILDALIAKSGSWIPYPTQSD